MFYFDIDIKFIIIFFLPQLLRIIIEASCGAGAQSVKPAGCGFDAHSRRWNIYLNLYFHFFALVSRQSGALSSATQHAMPLEYGRKWWTECLNTRYCLPCSVRDTTTDLFIYLLDILQIDISYRYWNETAFESNYK